MVEIIPAIMPKDREDLESLLGRVVSYTDFVQIDVMDGRFVESKSWPYAGDYASFEVLLSEDEGLPFWEKLDFEVDLMVSDPENIIDDWITAGAARLVVHVESTKRMPELIKKIKQRDVELVLALSIDTPTDEILPYLEDIDGVQFMGITTIGYQGQSFDERVIDKIRIFHDAHPEMLIAVDGGVNFETAHSLVEVGARRLVSGSAVFESGDIRGMLEQLRNS